MTSTNNNYGNRGPQLRDSVRNPDQIALNAAARAGPQLKSSNIVSKVLAETKEVSFLFILSLRKFHF